MSLQHFKFYNMSVQCEPREDWAGSGDVAARSKEWFCGSAVAGIVGANPAGGCRAMIKLTM